MYLIFQADEDICYGVLAIIKSQTQLTEGGDTYQLVIQKGCSKKTSFVNNLSTGAISAKNDNCYQTEKIEDSWNNGQQEYSSMQNITGSILKLSSSEVFQVKDQASQGSLPDILEWQMEACHCDWSMCNTSPVSTTVSLAVVWVFTLCLMILEIKEFF